MTARSYVQISENLKRVQDKINAAAQSAGRNPAEVRLMAVTKTVPAEDVNIAIGCGVHLLGENRAQELCAKYPVYENNPKIHFIGALQSNKVRQIIDKVDMIHSVDRLKLAAEISAQAVAHGKIMQILIEVNIGDERSKSGASAAKAEELVRQAALLAGVKIVGFMTIPPFSDDISDAERYFYRMQQLFVDIRQQNIDNVSMEILSMGMSGDFEAAIKHGSSIVRVGSAIFGTRL